jgi:uncharacterized pyridoxamine 5'-phosphate oxidase family protein
MRRFLFGDHQWKCACGQTIWCSHENDGDLFITAADTKAVYRQMKQNSNIQIVVLKHETGK